jgi:hypothetical protein
VTEAAIGTHRKEEVANVYYFNETWVNNTQKNGWKMDDGSGGLKVPICNGGRIIICHAGSDDGCFVPASKLIFPST